MPLKPGPFFRDTCMCGEILREYIDIIHPNSSCGFPARLEFRFGKTTWHRPSPHQAEETCVADRGRGLSQVRGICSVRRQAVPRGRWVVACSNGNGEGFLRASCWGLDRAQQWMSGQRRWLLQLPKQEVTVAGP